MANNATDPTGRSILTQVAFKGAVEAACAGGTYDEAVFFSAFEVMQELLMSKVVAEQEAYFAEATARKAERIADGTYKQGNSGGGYDAGAALADEFGATPTGGVEVAGKQHGPLPQWFIAAAAAKGVTRVYDNRVDTRTGEDITQRTGKTPPWFKSTEGDIPFWPPKH